MYAIYSILRYAHMPLQITDATMYDSIESYGPVSNSISTRFLLTRPPKLVFDARYTVLRKNNDMSYIFLHFVPIRAGQEINITVIILNWS